MWPTLNVKYNVLDDNDKIHTNWSLQNDKIRIDPSKFGSQLKLVSKIIEKSFAFEQQSLIL